METNVYSQQSWAGSVEPGSGGPADQTKNIVPRTARDWRWWVLTDLLFAPVAVLLWLTLPSRAPFPAGFAVAASAVFLIANIVTLPTPVGVVCAYAPAFVLVLLTVPINLVAIIVVAGGLVAHSWVRRLDLVLWRSLGDNWFCIVPILIVTAWAPMRPNPSAWPIYVAAIGSALFSGFVVSAGRFALMYASSLRSRLSELWSYAMDAMLAPIGLTAAFVAHTDPAMALASVLGMTGVLELLARERRGRLKQQLRALHDPLTGLANRNLFTELLDAAARRCDRTQTAGAVLLMDLDHFKQINDTRGHACGDAVLRAFAARLRANVTGADTVARLGGDEFAVLLRDPISMGEAEQVARKIAHACQIPVPTESGDLTLVASIGAAQFGAGKPPMQALACADAAMYKDKESRRGGC